MRATPSPPQSAPRRLEGKSGTNMRTTKTKVAFRDSFILNQNAGELPAGSYDVEIDEDEIVTTDRTGYRRTAIYFFVKKDGSTRMLTIEPADFESALCRDKGKRA